MSAFLFLLVKLNLAMGMAILLVALLRRPLRASFGATIAYAIWLLVPIAGIASLFPPRVAAPPPVTLVSVPAPPVSAINHIAHSALRVTEQLTGQGALPAIPVPPPATVHAMPDTALLLFATWAVGMVLMALYLIRLQLHFSAAVRRGEAGPAVLGFLRARIVTPDNFQEHFTPQEQAAILAHERVHLARQDARINALTALLRCLCWFNPIIHLGARWLRIDQELACDATVVARAIPRQTYARALLKSQMMVTSLPLGCNWPGPQHPLIERIALLQRKPPGAVRRLAGVSLVMVAATSAGLGAWAAQPPVAAKPVAAQQPGSALATLAAPGAALNSASGAAVTAPAQTAKDTGLNPPAAEANPARSGNEASAQSEKLAVPSPDLSRILPNQNLMTPTVVASNAEPLAPGQPMMSPSRATTLNDQPAGQPATRDLSVQRVQASLSTPPATLPKLDTNAPYEITRCDLVGSESGGDSDGTLMGRVTSSTTVQVPSFDFCRRHGYWKKRYGYRAGWGPGGGGPCENRTHTILSSIWGRYCPAEPWFTINLLFANPAEASKMPLGRAVRLKGVPFIITQNNVDYLGLKDAKVLYADPFGR